VRHGEISGGASLRLSVAVYLNRTLLRKPTKKALMKDPIRAFKPKEVYQ